jgi:hypothetical protein
MMNEKLRAAAIVLALATCVGWERDAAAMSFCVRKDASGNIRENSAIHLRTVCRPGEKALAISLEDGEATVRFTGVNVQVVSGSGATDGPPNGRGNVVVGYDEKSCGADKRRCATDADCSVNRCVPYVLNPQTSFCTVTAQQCQTQADCQDNSCESDRQGSHNVVIGDGHRYGSYGGLVAGAANDVRGPHAVAVGGEGNVASGFSAVVTGGAFNVASGRYASVAGGRNNRAGGGASLPEPNTTYFNDGAYASIAGGRNNVANGTWATIAGGASNTASGETATAGGGFANTVSGPSAVVSGGSANTASTLTSAVCGGQGNTASGVGATVAGGFVNIADGAIATVSGGVANVAGTSPIPTEFSFLGPFAQSICGGRGNRATGIASTVGGGRSNVASGDYGSVSGGNGHAAPGLDDWSAGALFEDN